MIDIENEVYTQVRSVLPTGTSITSVYVYEPASFPHVYMYELKNNNVHQDNGDEKFASIGYSIEVDTVGDTRKTDAKTIMKLIDTKMLSLGFTRNSATPAPNQQNLNVYRYIATYDAVTDGTNIYRR